MEYKGKEEQHVKFAKDFKTFLLELQKYVKSHHTTGLAWNPRGGSIHTYMPHR
jgi:adenylyl cyclase-associated protein